jgi:serine protease Do
MRSRLLRLTLPAAWLAAPLALREIHAENALPFDPVPLSAADSNPATDEPVISIGLLRQVQEGVSSLLETVSPSLLCLRSGDGTASGVIVSEDGLILTAAHVTVKPGVNINVVLPDGGRAKAVSLGLDTTTDAGLARITHPKKQWPVVPVLRQTGEVVPGQWCFALGHPGGWDEARGAVLRIGRVLRVTANSLQTDCVLMGGDSGGPLFDLQGRVIGIHSQIWTGRNQNMHVSMAPFLRSWEQMKGSEVIRVWATGSGGYLGIAAETDEQGAVVVAEVMEDSPAAASGILPGDVIERLDSDPVTSEQQLAALVRGHAPGDQLALTLLRHGKPVTATVELSQKPKETLK